jgi:hypothetical protein
VGSGCIELTIGCKQNMCGAARTGEDVDATVLAAQFLQEAQAEVDGKRCSSCYVLSAVNSLRLFRVDAHARGACGGGRASGGSRI